MVSLLILWLLAGIGILYWYIMDLKRGKTLSSGEALLFFITAPVVVLGLLYQVPMWTKND